jgi:hypothetical protein
MNPGDGPRIGGHRGGNTAPDAPVIGGHRTATQPDAPVIGGHRTTAPNQDGPGNDAGDQPTGRARSNAISNKHITGEQFLAEAHTASSAVYFKGQDTTKDLPVGWKRVPLPEQDPKKAAQLEKDMKTADCEYLQSPSGQRFVAFRGTEMTKGAKEALGDWKNNAQQALGMKSEKYLAAARIGEAFKNEPEVAFTGHSLGGGLAKLAAEKASTPGPGEQGVDPKVCVGFNAAPVNPKTYEREGLAPKEHLRIGIHVVNENDALNRMVKGGKTTAFGGEQIGDREREGNSMIVLAKGAGTVLGASGHGNKNIIQPGSERGDRVQFHPLQNGQGQSVEASEYDKFVPSKLVENRELAQQALQTVNRAQPQQEFAIGSHRAAPGPGR